MQATINGKTIVTIRDEQGLFHAVEVTAPGFVSETDALRLGIQGLLDETEVVSARQAAERLLDEDEYFAGKSNAQKQAILRAAKLLGRTVYLNIERGDESITGDYEVRIVGTSAVGLRRIDTDKSAIIHYPEILGGYVNDPE